MEYTIKKKWKKCKKDRNVLIFSLYTRATKKTKTRNEYEIYSADLKSFNGVF